MTSEHYSFSDIDIDKDSVIELDVSAGPITIDVVGDVDFDGVELNLIGGSASDVLFQVEGNHVKLGTSNAGGSGSSGGGMGKIGSYVGTYLVPNGQLVIEEGVILRGTAYAENIHLKRDTVVNPQPAFELLIAASHGWIGMETCLQGGSGSSGKSGSSKGGETSGSSAKSSSGSSGGKEGSQGASKSKSKK